MERRTFLTAMGAVFCTVCFPSDQGKITPGRARERRRLVSRDGRLDFPLEATRTSVDIPGFGRADLFAFNGSVPGPVIEARPNDEIGIDFRNRLGESTNLHFHGLHVPPTGQADNVFLEIPDGESFNYRFTIPADHPEGLFWIHPHLHGSVARQVGRGLAAPLIIRGATDEIPEVAGASEQIVILQDFDLTESGTIREPSMPDLMMGREGSVVTATGALRPTLSIMQGGLARLRLLNASPSRFYRLQLEEHPLHLIGTDGGPLGETVTVDEALLPPGARLDILVEGSRDGGRFDLVDLGHDRGSPMGMMGMGRGMMGQRGRGMMNRSRSTAPVVLATLEYRGKSDTRSTIPRTIASVEPLPEPDGPTRSFLLGMGMGGPMRGMAWTINGQTFDPNRIDARPAVGTTELWEYRNETGMDHPMHLHTNPVQIVGSDGRPEPAWRDIVQVPAGESVRVRIRFEDFEGKTVQHCHILDHEDQGMMATVVMEKMRDER